MISSQSFPHFRTSIRRSTDAPYFVSGSANWWVISTHCTSISPDLSISRSLAISTLSLRSCITFELLNVLQMICYLFWRALSGLFLIQRSLLSSKQQNGPYMLILQEPLFLMIGHFSHFLISSISMWLERPYYYVHHRNTIWAPWEAPLGKRAWVASPYTITFRYSGFPRCE